MCDLGPFSIKKASPSFFSAKARLGGSSKLDRYYKSNSLEANDWASSGLESSYKLDAENSNKVVAGVADDNFGTMKANRFFRVVSLSMWCDLLLCASVL